jgi:rubrerythrin
MVAQKIMTTDIVVKSNGAAVQEATRILATKKAVRRWACEVCGMIHTSSAPTACECCGATVSPVQETDVRREINSRW